MSTSQLRLYTIRDGHLDDFVRAWSESVVPLRRAHGYEIDAAWRIPDDHRFCWVVHYSGPLAWDEAEAAYYGSPERKAMDPDPAQWVQEQQVWFAEPVATTL